VVRYAQQIVDPRDLALDRLKRVYRIRGQKEFEIRGLPHGVRQLKYAGARESATPQIKGAKGVRGPEAAH